MKRKVKPQCPSCKTIGNMAGDQNGVIFCVTCGGQFTKQDIINFIGKQKDQRKRQITGRFK